MTFIRPKHRKAISFLFSFLAFLCAFHLGAFAQKTKKTHLIAFDQDSVDLGRLKDTLNSIPFTFSFVNTSQDDVFVKRVDADCACAESKTPGYFIQASEKGAIKVEFLPYRAGRFEKRFKVVLTGRDTTKALDSLYLSLGGYIEPAQLSREQKYPHRIGDIGFRSSLLPLGTVEKHQIVKRKLEFYNWGNKAIHVLDSIASPKHITLTADDSSAFIKPGTEGYAWLYYKPEIRGDLGFLHDNVVLYTDHHSPSFLNISLTAFVKLGNEKDFSEVKNKGDKGPLLDFSQAVIDFGKIASGKTYEQQIVLYNKGDHDLIIEKTYTEYGCELSENLQGTLLKAGAQKAVKVKMAYIRSKEPIERKIVFFTNDATDASKYLTIKAYN